MCRSVVENLQEHLSPPPSSSGVGGGSGGGAEGGQWTHTAGEALLCDVLGAFFMNVMQLGGEGLSWFTGMATGANEELTRNCLRSCGRSRAGREQARRGRLGGEAAKGWKRGW